MDPLNMSIFQLLCCIAGLVKGCCCCCFCCFCCCCCCPARVRLSLQAIPSPKFDTQKESGLASGLFFFGGDLGKKTYLVGAISWVPVNSRVFSITGTTIPWSSVTFSQCFPLAEKPGDTVGSCGKLCAAGKHYNPNGARILITSCITDAEVGGMASGRC